jgi:cytoskeleton protein RodZ
MSRFATGCALTRSLRAPIFSAENFIERMPPTPFGERLKRERELRGVSLVEVSVATRINTKYLEALENEQWDQLPRGMFTRGFIRTIARYLGLNEDGLISEYALSTNDHPTVTVWVHDLEKQPRKWVPAALVVALIAILAAGGWLAAKHWGGIAHVNAKPDRETVSEAEGGAAAASAPADSTAAAARTAAPAVALPAEADSTAAAPRAVSDSERPAASVVPAVDGLAPIAEKLELRIQAGRKARIRVAADGQPEFSGWIEAGETQSYFARDTFKVSTSDSSAVLMELNGKTMGPLGTPGRPGHATLTRKDLRDSPGGSH